MLRNARHEKILELIDEREVETQEGLCEALSACNFSVTQATVSRDIKELHLFKVKGNTKRFRYASIRNGENGLSDKMRSLFKTCVVEIRAVGNLILVKTLNGNGGNAGAVIDRLSYPEVVGSIAGDDTVLSVCETPAGAQAVYERLESIIED